MTTKINWPRVVGIVGITIAIYMFLTWFNNMTWEAENDSISSDAFKLRVKQSEIEMQQFHDKMREDDFHLVRDLTTEERSSYEEGKSAEREQRISEMSEAIERAYEKIREKYPKDEPIVNYPIGPYNPNPQWQGFKIVPSYNGIPDDEINGKVILRSLEHSSDPNHHSRIVTTEKGTYHWNGERYEKQ